MMGLSIIVPTIERPSLAATLKSAKEQILPEDEVIVVGSGQPRPHARLLAEEYGFKYLEEYTPSLWAADRRNLGTAHASGSHLLFLDDDDTLAPESLERVRFEIESYPRALLLFRVLHPPGTYFGGKYGHRIWRDRDSGIVTGNVSSGCLVAPNISRLPKWVASEHAKVNTPEDVIFAQDCAKKMQHFFIDADLVWCRPHVPAEPWQLAEGQ